MGHLGRRFGFAADHVGWIDLLTAEGRLRRVSADGDGDGLFWALRGAGANFGVVTALEIDLFPVTSLVGGELAFGAEQAGDVLHTYADWAAEVPETMASSVLLLRYPDDPAVPGDLRGRHVTHTRVAYSADDEAEGWRGVERLRRIGPRIVDTVRVMPDTEVGTIHHEPVDERVAAFDRDRLLDDVAPWGTGTSYLNFNGVEDTGPDAVRRTYGAEAYDRLRRIKATHDPGNPFRVNYKVPPA